jgi:hypothetical protein
MRVVEHVEKIVPIFRLRCYGFFFSLIWGFFVQGLGFESKEIHCFLLSRLGFKQHN